MDKVQDFLIPHSQYDLGNTEKSKMAMYETVVN